jgi:DNA-binding LacI/PurR family transcriptional regulator
MRIGGLPCRGGVGQNPGMSQFRVLSASEQVAGHLRDELRRGTWTGVMPGEDRLMARLGAGRNTIQAALGLLEQEGLLVGKGAGHQRRIVPQKQEKVALRVRILLYEVTDRSLPDNVELFARLQEAGYAVSFSHRSLCDLAMSAHGVAAYVHKHPADAWVVSAGSSEVLEWFSQQPIPAIAMFGIFSGLPIAAACPRKTPAMLTAVRKLVALGHRRIVMLAREERRKPNPGLLERTFIAELKAHDIPVSPYNLPDWDDTQAGLHACLNSLFRHTPPSALIIGDGALMFPVHQFLASRGIRVPAQVSLFSLDPDPAFPWCDPVISHIDWDYRPVVRRVLRWVDNVAHGREDLSQRLYEATYVEGGTIGPVAS